MAIANAKSLEEVERLSAMLQSGQLPGVRPPQGERIGGCGSERACGLQDGGGGAWAAGGGGGGSKTGKR